MSTRTQILTTAIDASPLEAVQSRHPGSLTTNCDKQRTHEQTPHEFVQVKISSPAVQAWIRLARRRVKRSSRENIRDYREIVLWFGLIAAVLWPAYGFFLRDLPATAGSPRVALLSWCLLRLAVDAIPVPENLGAP